MGEKRTRSWASDWTASTKLTSSRVKSDSARKEEGRDVKSSNLCRCTEQVSDQGPRCRKFSDHKQHSLTHYSFISLFIHLESSTKHALRPWSALTATERLPWAVCNTIGLASTSKTWDGRWMTLVILSCKITVWPWRKKEEATCIDFLPWLLRSRPECNESMNSPILSCSVLFF